MNYFELETMVRRNETEIESIEKRIGDYCDISDEAALELISYFKEQNERLQEFINYLKIMDKRITSIRQKVNLSVDEKTNQINKIRESVQVRSSALIRPLQGKLRDIFSALINEKDKQVYNNLFAKTPTGDKLFKKYSHEVKKRYTNPLTYFIKNTLIALGIMSLGIVIPPIGVPIMIADGIYVLNTVMKTILTIYNKKKFGGKKIERQKQLSTANYLEKIKIAIKKLKREKRITNSLKRINIDLPILAESKPLSSLSESDSHILDRIKSIPLENASREELEKLLSAFSALSREAMIDPQVIEYHFNIWNRLQVLINDKMIKKSEELPEEVIEEEMPVIEENNPLTELENFSIEGSSIDEINEILEKIKDSDLSTLTDIQREKYYLLLKRKKELLHKERMAKFVNDKVIINGNVEEINNLISGMDVKRLHVHLSFDSKRNCYLGKCYFYTKNNKKPVISFSLISTTNNKEYLCYKLNEMLNNFNGNIMIVNYSSGMKKVELDKMVIANRRECNVTFYERTHLVEKEQINALIEERQANRFELYISGYDEVSKKYYGTCSLYCKGRMIMNLNVVYESDDEETIKYSVGKMFPSFSGLINITSYGYNYAKEPTMKVKKLCR